MPSTASNFDAMLIRRATQARALQQWRAPHAASTHGIWREADGRRLLCFASNDYFGVGHTLRSQVDVSQEAATHAHGAGASRLVGGVDRSTSALESTLAAMKGTAGALVFGSGYLAAIGTIPALVERGDLVLFDRLSHACLIDGVRLSGAQWQRFRHNDLAHLEALLARRRAGYRHCLIVTETIFGMEGTRAPLEGLHALADRYDSWLMTDDAHGLGLPCVRGNPALIQMGTLSKAAGAYGGYVCGSQALVEHLLNHARSVMFSTALPPAVTATAQEGLRLIAQEPQRVQRVLAYARRVAEALGLDAPCSPIIPVILGDNVRALAVQAGLRERGIEVPAIRPPTVPPGTARLRISLSAAHSEAQVEQLIDALRSCLAVA